MGIIKRHRKPNQWAPVSQWQARALAQAFGRRKRVPRPEPCPRRRAQAAQPPFCVPQALSRRKPRKFVRRFCALAPDIVFAPLRQKSYEFIRLLRRCARHRMSSYGVWAVAPEIIRCARRCARHRMSSCGVCAVALEIVWIHAALRRCARNRMSSYAVCAVAPEIVSMHEVFAPLRQTSYEFIRCLRRCARTRMNAYDVCAVAPEIVWVLTMLAPLRQKSYGVNTVFAPLRQTSH